ncbi:MAG: paraquat-inducible protein A [Mariprofundus sp.]|nr:paraquat-inducible protein A [Mariprofundus sp.]
MSLQFQPTLDPTHIRACHECDLLHHIEPLPAGSRALCSRCGSLLYRNIPNARQRAIALSLAALIALVLANMFPFISFEISGRIQETIFISGALSLWHLGMGELGALVFLTSVLFPLLTIIGMLYTMVQLKPATPLPGSSIVCRAVVALMPWCMLDVLLLSTLIAMAKLLDIAYIIPGISFYAFVALVFLMAMAYSNFDATLLWPLAASTPRHPKEKSTALASGWISCHTCSMLLPATSIQEGVRCARCCSPLHQRKIDTTTRTWAWIITSVLLFIPANIYPVMTVIRFGQGEPNTIISGVIQMFDEGMWPLGMIVFVASIIIPVMKLLILTFLQLSVQQRSVWRLRDRSILYRYTELIGSWSMVDIFVIALLTALVKLGAVSSITPGIGAVFFATMVLTTILAARSFDPRFIWDRQGEKE